MITPFGGTGIIRRQTAKIKPQVVADTTSVVHPVALPRGLPKLPLRRRSLPRRQVDSPRNRPSRRRREQLHSLPATTGAAIGQSPGDLASGLEFCRGGGVQAQFGPQDPNRARKPRQRKPRLQERFPNQAARAKILSPDRVVAKFGVSAARCAQK